MIIKNTVGSYCAIKEIKIHGMRALITLIVYSSVPQTTNDNRVFNFYLRDFDKGTLLQLSNNNYWIDRCNNYDNDNHNIDINLYKELIFEVDITNLNQAMMLNNKWVRHCSIVIIDNKTKEECWESETLELISKELSLPTISQFKLSNKQNKITVSFNLVYKLQEDFNYKNTNLQIILNTKSIYTNEIIESSGPLTNNSLINSMQDVVNYTFMNDYNYPVIVEILIQNLKGETLTAFKKLYANTISSLSIKKSDGIHNITSATYKLNGLNNIIAVIKK